MMNVKGVVHLIPCAECSATYVEETGRTLRVRMAEHRRPIKSKDLKNGGGGGWRVTTMQQASYRI